MGQLVNSMVRGFGMTLGRKAANAAVRKATQPTTQQVSFSQKQMELINKYEEIINNLNDVKDRAKNSLKEGKLTEAEYEILMSQADTQLSKTNIELEKVRSAQPKSSGSFWKWFFILVFGVPFIIGLIKGLFN